MAEGDGVPKPSGSGIDRAVVVVFDRQRDLTVDEGRWAELMRRVLAEEQVSVPWEAGLSFVDADEMAALNAAHRKVDRPTDVLAFGADDGSAPRGSHEPRLVGDVVICPSVAAASAEVSGRPIEDELALLVVHGALHLLGYDHVEERDAEKMEGREQEMLALDAATDAVAAVKLGSP